MCCARYICLHSLFQWTQFNDLWKVLSPNNEFCDVGHTSNTAKIQNAHCLKRSIFIMRSSSRHQRRIIRLHCIRPITMGLLPDTQVCGVAHAPGMPGTGSPPPRVSDHDMHVGVADWRFPLNSVAEKTSRHSWRMRKPLFYTSVFLIYITMTP